MSFHGEVVAQHAVEELVAAETDEERTAVVAREPELLGDLATALLMRRKPAGGVAVTAAIAHLGLYREAARAR